jgi:acetoin utilization protein AcuB
VRRPTKNLRCHERDALAASGIHAWGLHSTVARRLLKGTSMPTHENATKSRARSRAKAPTRAQWTAGALMTPQPLTIGRTESLMTAHRLMGNHRVRHLPVLEHGELIGIVSQRDLYFLETIRGVDLDNDTVEDAMTTDTYVVAPDTPIRMVAKQMARPRYGCAVVLERGKVAGVFTATDALRLLSTLAPLARTVRPTPRRAATRAA